MKTRINIFRLISILLILSGIGISAWQLLLNRTLWQDEAMLALNIVGKNFAQLLLPLDQNQVAPVLYLYLVKFCSLLIPNSELGLRLVSFLAYVFSLIYFQKLLKLLIHNQLIKLLLLTLFVFNQPLIFYSGEVKQYCCDVLVAVLLMYFTLKPAEQQQHKYLILTCVGMLGILLSNITVLLLFPIGFYLLIHDYKRNHILSLKQVFAIIFSWVLVFAVYYLAFIHNHPSKEFMVSYWNSKGFMPSNPFSGAFYGFLFEAFHEIFCYINLVPFYENVIFIEVLCLLTLGVVSLFKQKQMGLMAILIVPILLNLILSAVSIYPFHSRLIIYIYPLIILLIGVGLDWLTTRFSLTKLKLYTMVICGQSLLIIGLYFIKLQHPYAQKDLKGAIKYVNKKIQAGEKVFVYYEAIPSFKYYQKIGVVSPELPVILDTVNVINTPKTNNVAGYDKLVSELNGDYWFLFMGVRNREKEFYLLNRLKEAGYEKLDSNISKGASAFRMKYSTDI